MDSSHADFIWPPRMVHVQQEESKDQMDTSEDERPAAPTSARKSTSHQAAGSAAASAAASAAVHVHGSAAISSTHDTASIGVDDELIQQLHAFATRSSSSPSAGSEEGSKMAGALSMGLCCQ
jgi:hypothetical protein